MGALVAVSVVARAAVAQPVSFRIDPGVTIEARWALAMAMNDRARGVGETIPLGIELGYRFTPRVQAGVLLRYSSQIKGTTVGANVRYHTAPGTGLDPWVGFGMAYETARRRGTFEDPLTTRATAFQLGVFEAGADMPFTPSFWVGPYLELSLGGRVWLSYGVRFNLLL
jgi:hypothetical protein